MQKKCDYDLQHNYKNIVFSLSMREEKLNYGFEKQDQKAYTYKVNQLETGNFVIIIIQ